MAVTNEEIVRTVRDSINTLPMARLCLYTGREQAVEYDYPFYVDISYIIGSYVALRFARNFASRQSDCPSSPRVVRFRMGC